MSRLDVRRTAKLKELAGCGPFVAASLWGVKRRCGNPRCRCAHGQPHKAYVLTREVRGKALPLHVPKGLVGEVRTWVTEHARVKRLLREDILQKFTWVNGLDHEGRRLCGFERRESRPDRQHDFAWLTDIPLDVASVIPAANKGGRLRWKIENEGFNSQKNSGYALEHAYSANDNPVKSFYYLLQVAHAINQLITKGSLLRDLPQLLGSFRNYLRRLAEAFRTRLIPPEAWDPLAARSIQIRFDSS